MLSEAEIQHRLPVWHALSELFLDTELDDVDLDGISARLLASGSSITGIRWILKHEVAPAFAANLLSVAGEWAGWTQDDVGQIVAASLRRRLLPRPLRWIMTVVADGLVAKDWARVEARLSA